MTGQARQYGLAVPAAMTDTTSQPTQTDTQTDLQTDTHTDLQTDKAGRAAASRKDQLQGYAEKEKDRFCLSALMHREAQGLYRAAPPEEATEHAPGQKACKDWNC